MADVKSKHMGIKITSEVSIQRITRYKVVLLVRGLEQECEHSAIYAAAKQGGSLGRTYGQIAKVLRSVLEVREALRARHAFQRCGEHQPKQEEERPFSGSVARGVGSNYNPAAHGGICVVQTCGCGAARRINANQNHEETGRWLPEHRKPDPKHVQLLRDLGMYTDLDLLRWNGL